MAANTSDTKPVTLTRDELYRLVWETPMTRLAMRFGVSGNGLAKICDRLLVSYPPRGYWARLAAGQSVTKTNLLPPTANTPSSATITPTPPPPSKPELPADARATVDRVRAEALATPVPERLSQPHVIVARWLADHEKRKAEARRERDPWRKKLIDPGDLSPDMRRRYRLLDALFKAVEKNGGKVKEDDRRQPYVELSGEKIEYQIREKQRMVRQNDTRQFQSTGKLVFAIKTYLPSGLQREWTESDETVMEILLPDIIATLVAAGPLLAERAARIREEQHKRQIEERKRYEKEQERKLQENRIRCFREFAQKHHDVQAALAFLEALRAATQDTSQVFFGNKVSDWFDWLEDGLKDGDPINSGVEPIFSAIAKVTAWTYRE